MTRLWWQRLGLQGRLCRMKISHCAVWITWFSDHLGLHSSADGSACISHSSLSSSFYHPPLLPLQTAAMNAAIYSDVVAGQSLFQARRHAPVLQGCFEWLLCVKACFIFRFNPCNTCCINFSVFFFYIYIPCHNEQCKKNLLIFVLLLTIQTILHYNTRYYGRREKNKQNKIKQKKQSNALTGRDCRLVTLFSLFIH